MFICIIFFIIWFLGLEEPHWGSGQLRYLFIYLFTYVLIYLLIDLLIYLFVCLFTGVFLVYIPEAKLPVMILFMCVYSA